MHNAVRQFIKEVRKEYPYKFRFKKVLEVGSKNINGSPRQYFWFCDYTGIDLSKGKGVNLIGNFNDYFIYLDMCRIYDVVVSTEMLEHDCQWNMSLAGMFHALKPGGLLIITCAGPDRMEHGTTDYYRNISTEDFKGVLPPELFSSYVLMHARGKNDLQFYGIKK